MGWSLVKTRAMSRASGGGRVLIAGPCWRGLAALAAGESGAGGGSSAVVVGKTAVRVSRAANNGYMGSAVIAPNYPCSPWLDAAVLDRHLRPPLRNVLWVTGAKISTEFAQPALFASKWRWQRCCSNWGVSPDLIGHGGRPRSTFGRLSDRCGGFGGCPRRRLMAERSPVGMVVVAASEEEVPVLVDGRISRRSTRRNLRWSGARRGQ